MGHGGFEHLNVQSTGTSAGGAVTTTCGPEIREPLQNSCMDQSILRGTLPCGSELPDVANSINR
jgi:hypothetical protein